jgi:hypothetical protein
MSRGNIMVTAAELRARSARLQNWLGEYPEIAPLGFTADLAEVVLDAQDFRRLFAEYTAVDTIDGRKRLQATIDGIHCIAFEGAAVRTPKHGDWVLAGGMAREDVVAMPREHWSGEGYGRHISEEWLLGSGGLPKGMRNRRRILAYLIRRALADHHGYALAAGSWPLRTFPEPVPGR